VGGGANRRGEASPERMAYRRVFGKKLHGKLGKEKKKLGGWADRVEVAVRGLKEIKYQQKKKG